MPRKRGATRPTGHISKIRISPDTITTITEYLMTSFEIKRPPEVTASVLALAIELENRKQPFPTRQEVAKLFNCSVFGVDCALSASLARGLLAMEMRTAQESIVADYRIVRHRYYHPTKKLLHGARETLPQVA